MHTSKESLNAVFLFVKRSLLSAALVKEMHLFTDTRAVDFVQHFSPSPIWTSEYRIKKGKDILEALKEQSVNSEFPIF